MLLHWCCSLVYAENIFVKNSSLVTIACKTLNDRMLMCDELKKQLVTHSCIWPVEADFAAKSIDVLALYCSENGEITVM